MIIQFAKCSYRASWRFDTLPLRSRPEFEDLENGLADLENMLAIRDKKTSLARGYVLKRFDCEQLFTNRPHIRHVLEGYNKRRAGPPVRA